MLLGIGATALAGSLVFAVAAGDGASTDEPAPDEPTVEEPTVLDAARYEATWIFNDPNRALGDGMDTVRPAVWLLDDLVVVASVDAIRAHDLDDGSVVWELPVEPQVCAAASDVPEDTPVIAFGRGEDCNTLTAIDVADGTVRWEDAAGEDDYFIRYETIVATPAGVLAYDGDGYALRDMDTGRVLASLGDDDVLAAVSASAPGVRRAYLEPEAALSADGTVLVVAAHTLAAVDGDPEPSYAVGIDPESAEILWTTQLAPDYAQLIPQAQDGAALVVGDLPGELMRLDATTGKIQSTYPIPADSPEGGRAEYERYVFEGYEWYRNGVTFVDGDPVLSYSNVHHLYPGGNGDYQNLQNLVRVDGETGEEVWRVRPHEFSVVADDGPVDVLWMAAGPMLDDDRMIVLMAGLERAFVLVIDAHTGEEVAAAPQAKDLAVSRIQQEPALFLVGNQLLMAFNPNGGTNQIDEAAELGTDTLSLVLLHPER